MTAALIVAAAWFVGAVLVALLLGKVIRRSRR